jgi:N-acyl-D-amino-acid deacylase
MKVCGKKNWGLIDQMLGMLEQAQKGDSYLFRPVSVCGGQHDARRDPAALVHSGGTDKLLERLASPELRAKMIEDIQQGIPGWDNFIDFAGLDQIFVTSVKTAKNQDAVGLNLVQLGELRGKIRTTPPSICSLKKKTPWGWSTSTVPKST